MTPTDIYRGSSARLNKIQSSIRFFLLHLLHIYSNLQDVEAGSCYKQIVFCRLKNYYLSKSFIKR